MFTYWKMAAAFQHGRALPHEGFLNAQSLKDLGFFVIVVAGRVRLLPNRKVYREPKDQAVRQEP
ncbi:MAG: hypothetical protein V4719_26895, partial [Planctomycetota bacterium]